MSDGHKCQTTGAGKDITKILSKGLCTHVKDRGQNLENGRVL